MEILIGILVYFGLAVLVGRFLSLSTRNEAAYCGPPASAAPLYSPAETVNLPVIPNETPIEEKETSREEEEVLT